MVEFRVGEDGLPYAIEFSNVSIWPRQPEAALKPLEKKLVNPRDGRKHLGRSHTMPSTAPAATVQKPLPSLPNEAPTRTGSLRRIFRRRFSEPGPRPQIHDDWMTLASRPLEGRGESNVRGLDTEGDERVRESIATLSLISEAEPQEEICPATETPTRARSLRRRPPISVLEHISSIIPEASPMLAVPPRKQRQRAEVSDELNIRSGGLHLSFPDGHGLILQSKTPNSRLRRLSRTVARAVQDAGMVSPSTSDGNVQASGGQSLFRGTYGQVRTALHSAGLVVKKCEEDGVAGGKRL